MLNISNEDSGDATMLSTTAVLYIPERAALIGFMAAILISTLGMAGNILTITALLRLRQTNFTTNGNIAANIFVIHLALTDLIFCSMVLPLTAGRYLTRRWPFGSALCRMFPMLYYGTVATSLMLITMITINRFVLIAFNQRYPTIYTRRNVYLMIAFCWLFSYGLMSVPFLELWGRFGYQPNTFSCTILRDQRGRSPKKFLFALGFFLPMTTIVVCYGLILFHIRRQSQLGTKHRPADNRLTMLICAVFGAFLLCFLPLFIGNVFIPDHRYPYFHVMASAFAWLNSCINPFIYFAMNRRYRAAFRRVFRSRIYSVSTTSTTNTNNNHEPSDTSGIVASVQ